MQYNKTVTLIIISILLLFMDNCISHRNSVSYEYAPLVKSVDIGPDSLNAAYLYEKANSLYINNIESLSEVTSDILNGVYKGNLDSLLSLIDENHLAIGCVKQASEMPFCDFTYENPLPFIGIDDSSRINYINLINISYLLILKGVAFDRAGKIDSAYSCYNTLLNCSRHVDSQREFIILSKMLELIFVQKTMQALLNHINIVPSSNSSHFLKIQKRLENYKKNRTTMGPSLKEELLGIHLSKDWYKDQFIPVFSRYQSGVDSDKIDSSFTIFYDTISQELLMYSHEIYSSYLKAFEQNDPLLVNERDTTIQDIDILLMYGTFNSLPYDNKAVYLAKNMAQIMNSIARPNYFSYIQDYYLTDVMLSIGILASKFESTTSILNDNRLTVDPYNHFTPFQIKVTDSTFMIYSYGPNRKNDYGKIVLPNIDRSEYDGVDIGYEFTKSDLNAF